MFSQEKFVCGIDSYWKNLCGIGKLYERLCGYFTIEDVFTTETVYICAKRAAAGFRDKKDTEVFQRAAWANSKDLADRVIAGTFRPCYYRSRVIRERGKERIIKPPHYECKVVQKVLCDYVVRPLLEMRMVSTNYASVKGRGTDKMHERILKDLNRTIRKAGDPTGITIVTGDYSGYFASIPADDLFLGILGKYIIDVRLINLMRMFSPEEYGLSLGNELSQIPASFYPSLFDHYVKDRCMEKYYRFMDDSLAILHDGMSPEEYIEKYKEFAQKYKLLTNDRKICVYKYGEPFIFCKERYLFNRKTGMYYRIMNPARVRNEMRKLEYFRWAVDVGDMEFSDVYNQFHAVYGTMKDHPNSVKQRNRLVKKYAEVFTDALSAQYNTGGFLTYKAAPTNP